MNINGKNILIYTKDKNMNNYLSRFFLGKNALPLIADDVNLFSDILLNEKIDIIIIDIQCSRENEKNSGFQLIKLRNDSYIFIPVIAIIDEFNSEQITRLFGSGVSAFFVRPFDIDGMETEICKIRSLRADYEKKMTLAANSELSYNIQIQSNLDLIGSVCHNSIEILGALRPDLKQHFNAIILTINEALQNAIVHGNKNNPEKKINFQFFLDKEKLAFVITDEGDGFEPETVPDPTDPEFLLKESGRGIFLMKTHMDEVNFYLSGKRIEIIKRF